MAGAQTVEHFGVCGIACFGFFETGKSQTVEQHLAKLLWRINVKFAACKRVYARFELLLQAPKLQAVFFQPGAVKLEAVAFHFIQYAAERRFDFVKQFFERCVFGQLLRNCSMQAEYKACGGLFSGINFAGISGGKTLKRERIFAGIQRVCAEHDVECVLAWQIAKRVKFVAERFQIITDQIFRGEQRAEF